MSDKTIDSMVRDYERGRLSRRQLMAHLSGLVAAAAATPALGQGRSAAAATFAATDVNHIALRVTDLDRSSEFYQRHLGLEVTRRTERNCFLKCRDRDFLALFRSKSPAMDHYAFSIENYSAADAVRRLEAAGLSPRREEGRVYFDDPDGLEVQVDAKD